MHLLNQKELYVILLNLECRCSLPSQLRQCYTDQRKVGYTHPYNTGHQAPLRTVFALFLCRRPE